MTIDSRNGAAGMLQVTSSRGLEALALAEPLDIYTCDAYVVAMAQK